MNNDLKGIYFARNTTNGQFTDITNLVDGVRVLSVTGFYDKGEPVNIYTAQWVNSQNEDFMIAHPNNTVIRKNVDIEITFIIHQKYAVGNIDATVLCERPKLRPFIDRIRSRLAECLDVPIGSVSVKGKTNEGMDAVGEGRGIAVHAVVLLVPVEG